MVIEKFEASSDHVMWVELHIELWLLVVAMVMVMGEGQLAQSDTTYTDTNADSCHGDLWVNE